MPKITPTTIGLDKSNDILGRTLERIASGRRINRAADDAAGMVIGDLLGSQARGVGAALRNASDAISIAAVAEGALSQATTIVGRLQELAIQANSAAQSPESRQALQAEAQRSVEALRSLAQSTRYNGQPLLTGSFTDQAFQVGTTPGETVNLSIPSMTPESLGSESTTLAAVDLTSPEGAAAALEAANAAMSAIDQARADLGAKQNSLQSTIGALSTASVNLAAAQSQVTEVDMAEEAMTLAQMKVLQRSRIFAATQAADIDQSRMQRLLQG